jgi:hypothetical protein
MNGDLLKSLKEFKGGIKTTAVREKWGLVE